MTAPYEAQARRAARDQGIEEFPLLVVEHPIAGHNAAGIRAKAEAIFADLLGAATR